jgi:lipase chaperone LimK
MRERRSAALACLSAAGLGAWWIASGDGGGPAPSADVQAPARSRPAPAAPASAPGRRTAAAPIARAHRGTDVDGGLATDASGHFVATPGALRLFEYFFLAQGEQPDAVVVGWIEAEIRARLSGQAAREALDLLGLYLGYRAEARSLLEGGAAPDGLERRLQWIRELRREVFGAATAAALFAERETRDLVALEQRRIALDPDLSDAERRARREAVEARLPERDRAARARRLAPLRSREEVAALREAGASPQVVFAARERRFGSAAAERLARLDRERAAWEAQLEAYRRERDALLDARGPDAAALEGLRARHFAPEERARVRALDALDVDALSR